MRLIWPLTWVFVAWSAGGHGRVLARFGSGWGGVNRGLTPTHRALGALSYNVLTGSGPLGRARLYRRRVATKAAARVGNPRFERYDVRQLYSVAHLFPKAKRTGVYVLEFSNGDRYVGRTVNIVGRFGNHRARWADIDYVQFYCCPRSELADLERRMIHGEHRRGVPLRNIVNHPERLGDSDLDPVVSAEERYSWLNEDGDLQDVAARADDPVQRRQCAARFRELKALPEFPFVAFVVNTYVQATILKPRETERTFWSLSALPSTNRRKSGRRLATLSINKMETLWLWTATMEDDVYMGGSINVARAALLASAGSMAKLRRSNKDLRFSDASYEAAGGDAVTVDFLGGGGFLQTMGMPGFVYAARELNLRLMRKGPTFQWRWHCYDLADWAVRPPLTSDEFDALFP